MESMEPVIMDVDTFQQRMKCICLELCDASISARRIVELCNEVASIMNEDDRLSKARREYHYHYGNHGTDGWMAQPSVYDFGYLDYLKQVLTKLLCTQLHVQQRDIAILNFIHRFHREWFGEERCWKDDELDALDELVHAFRIPE